VPTDEEILDAARRAGIDLDLLDTNLALSVAQRWQQHDEALELALALEKARVKLQKDSRTTE
jgi:hypothetical protein